MLLEVAEKSWMPRVFMIFGAFWVIVLIVLYVAVGVLLRKRTPPGGAHGSSAAHP